MDRKISSSRPPPPESNGDIIGWCNDHPGNKPLPSKVSTHISNVNPHQSPVQAVADSLSQLPSSSSSSSSSLSSSPLSPLSIWNTVMNKRTTYIRAMTSRLAEIKELSIVWKNTKDGPLPSSTRSKNSNRQPPQSFSSSSSLLTVYYNTLIQLRDSSHEWTAVDVLNTLNKCNGTLTIPKDYFNDDNAIDTSNGEHDDTNPDSFTVITLQGGIPLWTYPSYPSIEYLPYLIPVIENLLYSCYEDYITVALDINRSIQNAIDPLFQYAADCDEEDLIVPENNDTNTNDTLENSSEETKTNENYESKLNETSTSTQTTVRIRTYAERIKDYTIAHQAIETVEYTLPLLTALKSASINPGSTARTAHTQVIKYTELHASVKHLTRAAKFRQ